MTILSSHDDRQALLIEIESLKLANAALQQQLLDETEQADLMLRELERQRNKLRNASRMQQDMANRTQRVIDAVSSLVLHLDVTGRIVQANQRALAFLGLDLLDDSSIRYLDHWLSETDREVLRRQIPPRPWRIDSIFVECVRVAGQYAGHHALRRTDGQYRQFIVDATVLYSHQGKEEGTVVCAADVTELKTLEHELRQANAKAESAARSKSQFLANMSHEIRTPMNAIVGLSQLAMNQVLTPQVRDYLEKVKSASDHLLMVINDILDFSKIEAGGMTIESSPFSLHQLIANLDAMFHIPAENKGLQLSVTLADDVPAFVNGDRLRIQQILTNLLSNAIKFTQKGQVSLRIACVSSNDTSTELVFEVSDQGIGMSAEDQAKLFQPFSQADSSISRRFGGTGLGLTISQRLLHMMGSEFQIDSTVDVGSTFRFNLSLTRANEQLIADEPRHQVHRVAGGLSTYIKTHATALSGLDILIAEDNPLNRQVVREFLQMAGIKTVFAANGREAIDQLQQTPGIAAILMDVNMPEMSGIEATQIIRQQAAHSNLPIIALTAGVTHEERQNCLNAGMNDFVTKPIEPTVLLNTLLSWLKPDSLVIDATASIALTPTALDIPGFDLSNLAAMLDGDETMMRELLTMFGNSLSDVAQQARHFFNCGDTTALMDLAHQIKGTAGNYGAKPLSSAAAKLERAAKQNAVEEALVTHFCETCRDVIEVLAKL